MKIIVSPAKSLDFESKTPTLEFSDPQFLLQTGKIHRALQTKTPKKIAKLMNLSEKLSQLNWQRYQDFDKLNQPQRQAVFAFCGDVYLGLDSYTLQLAQIQTLQEKIRILSGFYGVLKPLDNIKAHRLEMGTQLKIGQKKNLYQFWGELVSKQLAKELAKEEPLINLASKEYFQVIQKKFLTNQIITPVFQDYKNGKYKVINFFAKKARGMMVRFLLDKNIQNSEYLKGFDYGGYSFCNSESSQLRWIFRRKK